MDAEQRGQEPFGGVDSGPPPVGNLVGDVIGDLEAIARDEVKLARTELKEEAAAAAGGAASLAAGGVIGLYGAGFLLLAAERLLARRLPDWAAAGLVGVALTGTAVALGTSGKEKLAAANPMGSETVRSLRETGTWAKDRLAALGR